MKLKFLYALDKVLGKLGLLILSMLPKKTRKVSQTFSNLLVIKFLGNGSLILAAPSLYAIKQKYPNIKLILYTTKSLQQQVDVLNIFDEIILLEPLKIIQSIFQIIQLKKRFTLERTFIVNLEAFSYISNFIAAFIRGIYVISLCQFEYKRVFDKSIVINSLTNISMAEQYDKIAEVLD